MRFTITITSGPHKGETFSFAEGGQYVVGRQGAAVALPKDDRCSAKHLQIDANPPRFQLTDLRSKNGVRLNDRRVLTADVQVGDRVQLGHSELRIDLVGAPQAPGNPNPPYIPTFDRERVLCRTITAVVYVARCRHDGSLIAVYWPEKFCPNLNERNKRASQLLELLGKHPHIARFHFSMIIDRCLVYATEYVPGIDLRAWVQKEGPRPVVEAVGVIRQVLLALQHVHDKGALHRNLLPDNIWLSGEPGRWHARLTDFGLARFVTDVREELASWVDPGTLTEYGQRAGMPSFVPPEQAVDLHSVTAAGDQYAAAAVLYFLLTGHAPYDIPPHVEDPFDWIRQNDPKPLRARRRDLPDKLETVLFKALQRHPQDRYPDVMAFDAALKPFAA